MNPPPPVPRRPSLWLFLWRAARLRCPECGVSPMFVPLRRTRTMHDWLHPLHGCPACDYPYEREPGYFLAATWIFQAITVLGVGTAWGFSVQSYWNPPLPWLLVVACVPTLLFAILFARHSKAFYMAVEHAVDPHVVWPPRGRTEGGRP